MAPSASSERAFSAAGITISKRRNRLKPDIVEALQYLKSTIHHGLLFREPPSSCVERKFYGKDPVIDGTYGDLDSADVAGEGVNTWDELIEMMTMAARPPEMTSTQITMCLYLVSSSMRVFYILLYVSFEPGPELSLPQGSAQAVNKGPAQHMGGPEPS